jgi:hypothetical protein
MLYLVLLAMIWMWTYNFSGESPTNMRSRPRWCMYIKYAQKLSNV